jgi:hypothetical protein
MSAKTLLDQIDDLSEDDNDFIPEPKAKRTSKRRRSSDSGSDSSDSESDDLDEEQAAKKAKVDPAEQERKEVQVQADFRSILDVEEEAKREREQGLKVVGDESVEIRRPRFYAGETI